MTIANYAENAILDALFNNASLAKSARYVKLHTGDPGETCTANAAAETTRKSLTGAAASGGVFTSVNALNWATYPAAETILRPVTRSGRGRWPRRRRARSATRSTSP